MYCYLHDTLFLIFFNIYVFIVSCQGIISNLSSTFSTNIYILYYFSLISVTANQFEQFQFQLTTATLALPWCFCKRVEIIDGWTVEFEIVS